MAAPPAPVAQVTGASRGIGRAIVNISSRGATIVRDIPLGRVATADEVARAVAWLAQDAPESMTGGIIDLNGASYLRP